jgi:tRNA-2-methylthio-N6-dimethylallyladenosine synthase
MDSIYKSEQEMKDYTGSFFVKTYGCQMNEYDSKKMYTILNDLGMCESEDINNSDIIIINTCHIRERATEKLYSLIGRLKKEKKKNSKIIISGCVAQAEGEEVIRRSDGAVDMIIGPQSIGDLKNLIIKMTTNQKFNKINLDFDGRNKFNDIPQFVSKPSLIENLTIQEGCDKFCKFCCVPYTRGKEYSRKPEEIFQEALILSSKKAKMINLLGQNVNAYSSISSTGEVCNLGILIRDYISKIKSFERIFYSTSHPNDMHEDLYNAHYLDESLGGVKALLPFVHLPIQSGSNKILKQMNRKHTREEYFTIIERFKRIRPDIQFSTDIIVGYPGENEEDFEETLDLVKKIDFASAFYFKYSPRPGTPAAIMDQVPEDIKSNRFAKLKTVLDATQKNINIKMIGRNLKVLFEGKNSNNQFFGRSEYMQLVFVNDSDIPDSINPIGQIVDVKIKKAFGHSLVGNINLNEFQKNYIREDLFI